MFLQTKFVSLHRNSADVTYKAIKLSSFEGLYIKPRNCCTSYGAFIISNRFYQCQPCRPPQTAARQNGSCVRQSCREKFLLCPATDNRRLTEKNAALDEGEGLYAPVRRQATTDGLNSTSLYRGEGKGWHIPNYTQRII